MKRKADIKGTKEYIKSHPKWTPERKAKFKAIMRAKRQSQKAMLGINRLAKFESTKIELPQQEAGLHSFKEHFIGMFAGLNSSVKRSILCALVKHI